jgi:hypothetical protein
VRGTHSTLTLCHTHYYIESHDTPVSKIRGTLFCRQGKVSERLSDLLQVTQQIPKLLIEVQPTFEEQGGRLFTG